MMSVPGKDAGRPRAGSTRATADAAWRGQRPRKVMARIAGRGTWSPLELIRWARLVAVPLVFLEVAVERENYPPGDERWAWALACAFAAGTTLFFFVPARLPALVFDTAIVSGFVVLYGFEPSSPVRELFVLVALEAALVYGLRGAVWIVAGVPALIVFERRAADVLGEPFDAGHVLTPLGIQLAVALTVGELVERRGRSEGPPRSE